MTPAETTSPESADRMRPDEDASGPPRRRARWGAAQAGALTVFLIAAVGLGIVLVGGKTPSGVGGGPGVDVSGKLVQRYDVADRIEVQAFSAKMLDGTDFESTAQLGRVSVYNVWGSWCGPCRTEAPDLSRVADDFAGKVRFVGINVRDSPDAARAFERSFGVPYSSIQPGDSSQALLAFGGALASAAVPSTVVVDRDGKVAARILGPIGYLTLRGLVEDVVAEGEPDGEPSA